MRTAKNAHGPRTTLNVSETYHSFCSRFVSVSFHNMDVRDKTEIKLVRFSFVMLTTTR